MSDFESALGGFLQSAPIESQYWNTEDPEDEEYAIDDEREYQDWDTDEPWDGDE